MKSAYQCIAAALTVLLFAASLTGCAQDVTSMQLNTVPREAIMAGLESVAQIPRASGEMDRISDWLRDWADENGLRVTQDRNKNVIIDKPASAGYEGAPTVILHSYMDMLCESDRGILYEKTQDGIQLLYDESRQTIRGDGTSLGASSGVGIATIQYVLTHAENHGPLRAVFTANGRTTMNGARNLEPVYLEGDCLVNMNWTSDNSAGNGSSAASSWLLSKPLVWSTPSAHNAYVLAADNFIGGRTGMQADKGQANPVKILAELLAQAKGEGIMFELASFSGGVTGREIPESSSAVLVLNDYELRRFKALVKKYKSAFQSQYREVEKNADLVFVETRIPDAVVSYEDSNSIVSLLYSIADGAWAVSGGNSNFVTASSNISNLILENNAFTAELYIQGNDPEQIAQLIADQQAIAALCGMGFEEKDRIPAWTASSAFPEADALLQAADMLYGETLELQQTHSTTELGFFQEKNPHLKILSIGPTIHNPGRLSETLSAVSISRPASLILAVLSQADTARTADSSVTLSAVQTEGE